MDDGELDFSTHEMFSASDLGDFPANFSTDIFLDELLNDSHACTHTHTCNPPGPDSSHTHTCFHVHTTIGPAENEQGGSEDSAESAGNKSEKRPLGNREAVRKYREKKKARAASLEDEIMRLKAVNQQLFKRLQGQAALEAEVARLRCLLVDFRGRIEGEIGSFPYQKPTIHGNVHLNNAGGLYVPNPCNIQCSDQLHCGVLGMPSEEFDGCDLENLQCSSSPVSDLKNTTAGSSMKNKRKGGRRGTNASC